MPTWCSTAASCPIRSSSRSCATAIGTDQAVADYVLARPETQEFLRRITTLLEFTLPRYQHEGKSYLTIAIGCTGGRHRSIVLVEELRRLLVERGYRVLVRHRDAER